MSVAALLGTARTQAPSSHLTQKHTVGTVPWGLQTDIVPEGGGES